MFVNGCDFVGPMLRVSTRTWTRDSHDLFDYETQDPKQLAERHFATSHGFRLLRSESTVSPVTSLPSTTDGVTLERDHLLSVVCRRPGEYTLTPAERLPGYSLIPQRLWLVVRALPDKRYALQEQDVVKLGRYRLRVKKIVSRDDLADFDITSLLEFPVPEIEAPDLDGTSVQCRICLSEGTNDDRLLCPCECKGSIKYVHAECMRRWVHLRSIKDSKESDQPLKAALLCESTCELCKARLPPFVRVRGELVPLIMMPDLSHPFIILDNVTPQANKGLHFISVQDSDYVRLGRGHDASVRIADVSISRNHATIFYENGTFYLEDHDSKFGTLVALRRPMPITPTETMAVQVGRSLIELTVDPTLRFVPGVVDIPPVIGRFSFCNDLDLQIIFSEPSTPMRSSIRNLIDDSIGTSADGFSQRSVVHFDTVSPMSMDLGESVQTSVRSAMPMYFSDSSPSVSSGEVSSFNNAIGRGNLYGPQSWDGYYGEDVTPHSICCQRSEEPCQTSTNDGVAYLRLILNTPSRNHILNNLRYNNRVTTTNRIFPQFDPQCFAPTNQQRGISTQPIDDPNGNSCFLPDNAFVSMDGSHDMPPSDMSPPPGLDGSRHVGSSPVNNNVHGMMQWMPMGPGSGSSIHPPK
ncbi:erythrocyte membrane protein [Babesia ovis]|uniref:Erythrocyte membrane protein n=1 Tax=Babesia ovis TaxID=5869 RepID=A0A9W5TEM3_BABOV|nr:erythrocyte membrane protein [Babesia ovis]